MYFKTLLLFAFLSILALETFAQTPSAYIIVESTDHGFLPPRMTTANRNNIAVPSDGMIIFNTSTGYINYYDGVLETWYPLQPPATPEPTVSATQTINVTSNSFKGTRSSDETSSGYGQGGAYLTNPAFARMTAGIQIPVGAVITSITFYYKDNNPDEEIIFRLDRESLTAGVFGSVITFPTGTATASDTWESSTLSLNHTVVSAYGYFIDAYSAGWDGNMVVKGASVTYTLPTN